MEQEIVLPTEGGERCCFVTKFFVEDIMVETNEEYNLRIIAELEEEIAALEEEVYGENKPKRSESKVFFMGLIIGFFFGILLPRVLLLVSALVGGNVDGFTMSVSFVSTLVGLFLGFLLLLVYSKLLKRDESTK